MKLKRFVSIFLITLILTMSFPFFGSASVDPETLATIDWFVAEMTVAQAKAISPAIIAVYDGSEIKADSDYVGTGDIIETANETYTAIVSGDLTGMGRINAASYMMIKRYHLGTYDLEGIRKLASDTNKNGVFEAVDYLMAKRCAIGTYNFDLPVNAESVPVLLYHHILPDDVREAYWSTNDITIATSEFRRHMQMLEDNDITVVTVSQIDAYVRGEILLPEDSVCLCFDDGYKSNTEYAAPILADFGYTATVFSMMEYFDGEYQEDYVDWDLQHITPTDLEKYPGTLDQQCHTWNNHNHLPEQTYATILTDLNKSQTKHHHKYFAYPYGEYDDDVIRAVIDAGFIAAFTTEPRNCVPGDNVYEIPRITINSPMEDTDYLALFDLD